MSGAGAFLFRVVSLIIECRTGKLEPHSLPAGVLTPSFRRPSRINVFINKLILLSVSQPYFTFLLLICAQLCPKALGLEMDSERSHVTLIESESWDYFTVALGISAFIVTWYFSSRMKFFSWCVGERKKLETAPMFCFNLSKESQQSNLRKHRVAAPIMQESDLQELDDDDEYLFYPVTLTEHNDRSSQAFTKYKRVDKKIKPVSTTFSPDYAVRHTIPEDPLKTLSALPTHPPPFEPSQRLTQERLEMLEINKDQYLTKEEENLFNHIMKENQDALAFEDSERGTFKDSYFSPYKIATVPHTPWEYRNIPIPPGILTKVIEVLKLKIEAGVYEPCQSSYRSRWFCVMKKNGKLRIVHDLQPLNKVSVRDAGMVPILDDFVEGFAGRQCYTVFDLYWGFDARKIEPESRDMTAFMTPLGLLRITSMPTGYTNSPAEFQQCMVFILHDEIPHVANIFIDDLPITAIGSTEGADRKFPFSAVFYPLQRIVSSSLSSAPFALKPG
jgi:hypothetical protein